MGYRKTYEGEFGAIEYIHEGGPPYHVPTKPSHVVGTNASVSVSHPYKYAMHQKVIFPIATGEILPTHTITRVCQFSFYTLVSSKDPEDFGITHFNKPSVMRFLEQSELEWNKYDGSFMVRPKNFEEAERATGDNGRARDIWLLLLSWLEYRPRTYIRVA